MASRLSRIAQLQEDEEFVTPMNALLKRGASVAALVLLFLCSPARATEGSETAVRSGRIQTAMQQGDFRQAIIAGVAEENRLAETGAPADRVPVLLRLASCYQALGHYRKAIEELNRALRLTGEPGTLHLRPSVLGALGNAYILVEQFEEAGDLLKEAHALGINAGDLPASAFALNSLGNLHLLKKMYRDALAAYTDGLSLARKASDRTLTAGILANTARAMALSGNPEEAGRYLDQAFRAYHELSDAHEKAYGFINIGQTYRSRRAHPRGRQLFREEAIKSFVEATAIAERVDDRLSLSYAAGYLGQTKEDDGRSDDALRFTRRALSRPKAPGRPNPCICGSGRLGRLLKAQGNHEGALSAYRQGYIRFNPSGRSSRATVKSTISNHSRMWIEPVYLGLVELLLRQADVVGGNGHTSVTEAYLIEAVRNLELLKTAELQDYFQNTCVTSVKTTVERQHITIRNTATVYFVPQPERSRHHCGIAGGHQEIQGNR